MKKRYQRLGVMGLAAVMACTGTVLPVLAGQASVAVDENMYVNLDYYGNVDRVNVVKGCDLNGQTTITDYGDYTAVTNMSCLLYTSDAADEEDSVDLNGRRRIQKKKRRTHRINYETNKKLR